MVELTFKSEPSGAEVWSENRKLGKTPMKVGAPPGKYIFKFAKQDYLEQWQRLVVPKSGSKTLDVTLEPVKGTVMIKTIPAAAKVEIDGKVVGETPLFLKDLPIGHHKAYLKRLNHVDKEISWDVTDARPRLLSYKLVSNIGNLKVGSTPEGASVKIDGNNRGVTPFETPIQEGKHKVEVEKEGYAMYEDVVVVERGKDREVTAELQILPGTISIKSTPSDATVIINDKQYKNTPVDIEKLKPGVYKVKLSKPGYDPYYRTIDVLAGRTVELNVKLDSNTGGIDLIVNPPGVTIYLDGKKIGVSEQGENADLSKVFEIRNISMGKHKVRVSHKRALPPDIVMPVRVPKGGIKRVGPVTMWIADTEIRLKDGSKFRGRIRSDNKRRREIMLEFVPDGEVKSKKYSKITQRFSYDEIAERKTLKREE